MRRTITSLLVAALLGTALPAAALPAPDAATAPGALESSGGDELIVMYGDDTITQADFDALADAGVEPEDVEVRRPEIALVKVPDGTRAGALADRIRANDSVVAVAPVGTVRALESVPPNDTRYDFAPSAGLTDQQLYLGPNTQSKDSIDLEPVWDAVFNGETHALEPDRAGVTLAIVDTGIASALMEDTGRFVPMWDYVNKDADPRDDYTGFYHGTRVASIIGAETDNAFGVAGALHNARNRTLIYKVLDGRGYGESIDTMIALMDAADDGAKVVNASLGEPATLDGFADDPDLPLRELWQQVVDYCVARGTLVVAASGNEAASGYTPVYYPAACEGALAVGSINPRTGNRSTFSCYGPELDLVAPGEWIWTVAPNGLSSGTGTGTSYASPLVAGSLALLWSLVPDLTVQQVAQFATSAADDAYGGVPGFDQQTGFGRFDAFATYEAMVASLPVQAAVDVTATAPAGFETTLTWTPAEGTNVHYLYGWEGGPEYATTATSGRLVLPSDGTHTLRVRSFADDRFDATRTATAQVNVATGLPPLTSTRLSGADRYETSRAISRAAFPGRADAVVIASGQNWPDGLAASVLARAAGGPLLLTRHASLSIPVRDELSRLKPARVYIIGGTSAVSGAAEESIRSLSGVSYTVTRLGGADRYATSALIAAEVKRLTGTSFQGRAVIASGQNYPDALSGSPVAARLGWPILLAKSGTLTPSTSSAIESLGIASTLVLGGEKVIGPAVLAASPAPTRLAGADRYETSRAIAEWATTYAPFDRASLGLATGRSFPDALSSGPLLAASATPLVLTDGLTPGLDTWLLVRGDDIGQLTLLGGPAAMPYALEWDVKTALRR